MTDMSIIDIKDTSMWDDLTRKGQFLTVIEFYAPWCRESSMMAEVIDKMMAEFPGMAFYRYNMDKLYWEAKMLYVTGIPSVVLMVPIPLLAAANIEYLSEPKVIESIKGFTSADVLREKLKAFMNWK